jgi:O-antigen ligase
MLTIAKRLPPRPLDEQPNAAARWLAVYAVVSVGRLPELIPFAHSLPLAKVAFAIVLIAAFKGRGGVSTVRLWTIDLARALALFAVLVVVSLIFSVWISNSFSFITGPFVTLVLGFFVAVKMLNRWCDIATVLKAFAVVGVILAAEALAGYSGGRAVVESSYDTNDLAYVLMGVLPIALAFGVTRSGALRVFWYGVAGFIAMAGLLTQSRGGLLALAAIVVLLVIKPLRNPSAAVGSRLLGGLLPRALLAVILSLAAWTQLPVDAQHRLGLLFSLKDDYNTNLSEEGGRSAIWKRNVIAGLKRPIGYGVATFEFVDFKSGGRYKAAHNSVIQIFVELGVVGLVLWLRLWFLSWRSLAPPAAASAAAESAATQQRWREQVVMAQALRLSLTALFIAGFFLSQAYSLILWQIFAVCAAIGVSFGTHAKRAVAAPRSRRRTARP